MGKMIEKAIIHKNEKKDNNEEGGTLSNHQ
jgi:hypothetical protein